MSVGVQKSLHLKKVNRDGPFWTIIQITSHSRNYNKKFMILKEKR